MPTLHARPAVNEPAKKVSERFPRNVRLLRHADFQTVYQTGRKHFSGNMTAFYRESDRSAGPRVGFTVGKVLGGAVVRNRSASKAPIGAWAVCSASDMDATTAASARS